MFVSGKNVGEDFFRVAANCSLLQYLFFILEIKI